MNRFCSLTLSERWIIVPTRGGRGCGGCCSSGGGAGGASCAPSSAGSPRYSSIALKISSLLDISIRSDLRCSSQRLSFSLSSLLLFTFPSSSASIFADFKSCTCTCRSQLASLRRLRAILADILRTARCISARASH